MHRKNLIIPLVGDFTGPKAIRAIARYLKDHNAEVTAFYVSNVEEYIHSPRSVWTAYCGNLAALRWLLQRPSYASAAVAVAHSWARCLLLLRAAVEPGVIEFSDSGV
jgi:hypothetical protein